MRGFALFSAGLVVGLGWHSVLAQERTILRLNHVGISVNADDFEDAARFYTETMEFPEVMARRGPDGQRLGAFFQVGRDSFVELIASGPERQAGLVHVALEVSDLEATVRRLRSRGVEVRDSLVTSSGSRLAIAQTPLKILPEAFASDPDRLARFQREAQVFVDGP